MGKGLNVMTSGVHIAFTAGTGILPFLDLVAYLIRLNLGILSEKNDMIEADETVPNREDISSRSQT